MRVFVHTLSGNLVSLEVELYDTTEDVKAKLEEETGISTNNILFIYAGTRLEDDKTLQEYSVLRDGTIDAGMLFPSLSYKSRFLSDSASHSLV